MRYCAAPSIRSAILSSAATIVAMSETKQAYDVESSSPRRADSQELRHPIKEERAAAVVPRDRHAIEVALLTGGADKPYALGLASALIADGVFSDFIGSDEISGPELLQSPQVRFLNLRGDQRTDAPPWKKAARVMVYYVRLLCYAVTARPKIFHILWNNKFEFFDRTVLMLYYKLLRKKIVLTAHNVNAARRDSNDSFLNRVSLKIQYRMADHIFLHTRKMKEEMMSEFGVPGQKISVIPFGINNTLPNSGLTTAQARERLGLKPSNKVILFFGNIAPYKGLEYLIEACSIIATGCDCHLIIAGRPKNCDDYWKSVQKLISQSTVADRIIQRIEYIPDENVEIYFKASDVLVLPYSHIFQSGVLFLGYSFGLPVIAANVGSLGEDIVEGETGFVFRPGDTSDLAATIVKYFDSGLFQSLSSRRGEIRNYANAKYSWKTVAAATTDVYTRLQTN